MTLTDYTNLKRLISLIVSESARHNHLLDNLKEFYKDQINSPRRFEHIKSFEELLHVLEIRGILSENDVSPLVEISSRLRNKSDLLKTIDDYKQNQSRKAQMSHNSTNGISDEFHTQSASRLVEQETLNCPWALNNKKWDRMQEIIKEEIGTFWKDLGRYLDIRECVINDIDKNNNSIAEKVNSLLEKYKLKADSQRWFYNLCNALEKSRRKDLSKSLQEIMTMNI